VGFQMKNGAIPHFKKIEKIIKNQDKPTTKMSFKAEPVTK
jgi:hypothetical protein